MTALSFFQQLLHEHEEDLQRIRTTYFPLLEERVITGYNLYPEPPDVFDSPYVLHYFHSDLGEDDKHFQELSRLLDTRIEKRISLEHAVVCHYHIRERMAAYLTRNNWEDSPFMRYYSFDGKEMSYEEILSSHKKEFIGEVLQHTLFLPVKSDTELRFLLDFFKEHTSKFLLDRSGRKVSVLEQEQLNPSAITSSWSLPLLTYSAQNNKKPKKSRDFLVVNNFIVCHIFEKFPLYLQILIRKKSEGFTAFLRENYFSYTCYKKYALRAFVEEYLDV